MLVVFKNTKIRGKTIAKMFGKVDTFWTYQIIGGVTYRRTNAPNLSRNDGLRKEIENREQEQQKLVFEQWYRVFRERERE